MARNQHIREYCLKKDIPYSRQSKHFFTFAKGKMEWCMVHKIASSFILMIDGYHSRPVKWNLQFFPTNSSSSSSLLLSSSNLEISDLGYQPKAPPTKTEQLISRFMIVRDPYSRVISAYVDRILTNPRHWEIIGGSIVKRFRQRPRIPNGDLEYLHRSKVPNCGNDVTFPEFIQYFIQKNYQKGIRIDGHIATTLSWCNPCKSPIDFVAHMETLTEDLAYIIGMSEDKSVQQRFEASYSDKLPDLTTPKVKAEVAYEHLIIRCESMCDMLRTLWWTFKIRGFLSRNEMFPLSQYQCTKFSAKNLGDIFAKQVRKIAIESHEMFDKKKQMREMMVELFLQVPLDHRLAVHNILLEDFQLFNYDPKPRDIYPELS